MPAWSPAAWGDFSVVALAVFVMVMMYVGQTRGWIVFGPAHRDIIAAKDKTIEQLNTRSDRLEDSNAKLSDALARRTGADELAARLLAETRKAVGQ